ncbi:hypothetical protein ACFYM0_06515 [Streptomyces sp. NPDC006487]
MSVVDGPALGGGGAGRPHAAAGQLGAAIGIIAAEAAPPLP